MKKDNPASDVPPPPGSSDPNDPMHFPAKKPSGPSPDQSLPTPPHPEHKPESPERVKAAQQEAVTAAATDVTPPNIAMACFNESQFKDAGNGWVYVIVKSPAQVYYGPGFPKPGEKFPYHGTDGSQAGKPVRDGDCKLTVKPGGTIAAQPTEENSGGWQFFWKQDGVVFCVPDTYQAFGFVYKRK